MSQREARRDAAGRGGGRRAGVGAGRVGFAETGGVSHGEHVTRRLPCVDVVLDTLYVRHVTPPRPRAAVAGLGSPSGARPRAACRAPSSRRFNSPCCSTRTSRNSDAALHGRICARQRRGHAPPPRRTTCTCSAVARLPARALAPPPPPSPIPPPTGSCRPRRRRRFGSFAAAPRKARDVTCAGRADGRCTFAGRADGRCVCVCVCVCAVRVCVCVCDV